MPSSIKIGECSNCEGEGWVTIWGQFGHEVPASRAREYLQDRPHRPDANGKIAGEPFKCAVCSGSGVDPVKEGQERTMMVLAALVRRERAKKFNTDTSGTAAV